MAAALKPLTAWSLGMAYLSKLLTTTLPLQMFLEPFGV
jgi:hypothetical protein